MYKSKTKPKKRSVSKEDQMATIDYPSPLRQNFLRESPNKSEKSPIQPFIHFQKYDEQEVIFNVSGNPS